MIYNSITAKLGNTPIVNLKLNDYNNLDIFLKLEYYNPTGSMKDRAADYIIKKLLDRNEIDRKTVLIESSSGNFGIALSVFSRANNLEFYCVVDPNISSTNEYLIKKLSTEMIKVTEPDDAGGYLLSRIKKVNELCKSIPNSYWINQYGNPYNSEAYYNTLGAEICNDFTNIDYIFIGVSSGGTITGVSQKLKEKFKNVRVIAVDIEGSVIFGGKPAKRHIPGIGSSMVPDILKMAQIDDVVMVDEVSTIQTCRELLEKHSMFVGGSSGSVLAAIKKYFKDKELVGQPTIVGIFADRGDRYINTVFNDEWCTKNYHSFLF